MGIVKNRWKPRKDLGTFKLSDQNWALPDCPSTSKTTFTNEAAISSWKITLGGLGLRAKALAAPEIPIVSVSPTMAITGSRVEDCVTTSAEAKIAVPAIIKAETR